MKTFKYIDMCYKIQLPINMCVIKFKQNVLTLITTYYLQEFMETSNNLYCHRPNAEFRNDSWKHGGFLVRRLHMKCFSNVH
jgi:hypothetical protein